MKFADLMQEPGQDGSLWADSIVEAFSSKGDFFAAKVVPTLWDATEVFAVTDFKTMFGFVTRPYLNRIWAVLEHKVRAMPLGRFSSSVISCFSLNRGFLGKLSVVAPVETSTLNKRLHIGSVRYAMKGGGHIDFDVSMGYVSTQSEVLCAPSAIDETRHGFIHNVNALGCISQIFVSFFDADSGTSRSGTLWGNGDCDSFSLFYEVNPAVVALLSEYPAARQSFLKAIGSAFYGISVKEQQRVVVADSAFRLETRTMECDVSETEYRVDMESAWAKKGYFTSLWMSDLPF